MEEQVVETVETPTESVETPVETTETAPERDYEKDRQYAAARRDAEEQTRIAKEEQKATQEKLDRLLKAVNNYGYEGDVEDIADLLEAQSRQMEVSEYRQQRDAEKEYIAELVNKSPEMQQVRAILDQNAKIKTQTIISNELSEIRKYDPNIKTIEDVFDGSERARIIGLLADPSKQGSMSLSEAWKATSTNKVSVPDNREHMTGINAGEGSSDNLVAIPSHELAMWQNGFPNATPQELTQKYNHSLLRQKGE